MDKINNGFMDYYYLDNNRVYNSKTKKYLRINKHQYKLLGTDNIRHSVSLKELYHLVYNKEYCVDSIKDLEGEQWKEIDNSGGCYFISNMGRIKSYKGYDAKLLVAYRTDSGYERVNADFGSGNRNYLIHRLVAEYFLDFPQKPFMEIHHKDFDKRNNRADNLQWVTKEEHTKIHMQHDKEIMRHEQSKTTDTNR